MNSPDLDLNVGPTTAVRFLMIARRGKDRTFSEGSGLSLTDALDLVGNVLSV